MSELAPAAERGLERLEKGIETLAAQRDAALGLCDFKDAHIEQLQRDLAQANIRIEELQAELRRRGPEAVR